LGLEAVIVAAVISLPVGLQRLAKKYAGGYEVANICDILITISFGAYIIKISWYALL